jgi:nitrite reductase/ring-hydroxylating ferredoxin subunit
MTRQDVCAIDEIQDGGKKAVKVLGTPLVLFRNGELVHVLKNRCAHMNLPLSVGKFDGTHITCAFHGARFDVRTGTRDKPAWFLGGMIGGDCVKRYDAVVENGRVLVEL